MARGTERVVGVISDTHGLVRPEALAALAGVDLIVHCGDVGGAAVLRALAAIAPVRAVRGNNDVGSWADELPNDDVVEVARRPLYLLHDLKELSLDPRARGFVAVLSGHSHRPRIEERDGVLFLNPGSAGPRRFKLPVSLARLSVGARRCEAKLVDLAA